MFEFQHKSEPSPVCPDRPARLASRRPSDPKRLLDEPGLAERLDRQLAGAPWDVFTTPEVALALREDLNPLTLNDWQYQRTPGRPPRELLTAWKRNVGYYRKDRLIGWAKAGGQSIPSRRLWQLSAEYIVEVLSFPLPGSLAETEELVNWLLANGLIGLRASPVGPFRLFSEDADDDSR